MGGLEAGSRESLLCGIANLVLGETDGSLGVIMLRFSYLRDKD